MANKAQQSKKPNHKLPKLPQNAKISKRRLTRPPIVAKSSGSQQIIYVSTRTPFMSAIARIRKHVSAVQKRRSQSVQAASRAHGSKSLGAAKGDRILAAAIESLDRQDAAARGGETEEVFVKGTGRAIGKVLDLAGWLQEHALKESVRVRLETGSWWAVDDVEVMQEEDDAEDVADGDMEVDEEQEAQQEVPESRIRNVSVLTIRVGVL